MFTERLNEIMARIGASAADVARQIGCDQSNISRMRQGQRTPPRDGVAAWRLVKGLYAFADAAGKTSELCAHISCAHPAPPEAVESSIMAWLYAEEPPPVRKRPAPKERIPYRSFGQRLNAVIELANISNIRLGKLLNLDPSYISRFRNGFRSPKSNPKTMEALCEVLLKRLFGQDKLEQLASLLQASPKRLADRDEAFSLLYQWLYKFEEEDASPFVESLLEQIGSIPGEIKAPSLSPTAVADAAILSDDEMLYMGTAGLQRAVLRFLGNVLRRGDKALYLYSDQNIDWLTRDPAFCEKWCALMVACVQNGTRITVIHNIDRGLNEMVNAIKYWLPLYPSGMVKAYYCRRQKNARLSTTLFLCPGYACIAGNNVIGQETEEGVYRYDTDPILLEAHQKIYRSLLALSEELVRVYRTSNAERFSLIETDGFTVLGNTLSLTTMPPQTLRSILDRVGVGSEEKEELLLMQDKRCALARRILEGHFIHECIPMPGEEELLSGRVPADIPGKEISYTLREYVQHMQNIMDLIDKYANYRFYALPETVFSNVQILACRTAIAVCRMHAPHITFLFTHAALCRAFLAYLDRIKAAHGQDKHTTRRRLERDLQRLCGESRTASAT